MGKWIIREYQRGLLYDQGRFVRVVVAGRYRYWPWEGKRIDVVDVRETSQTIDSRAR